MALTEYQRGLRDGREHGKRYWPAPNDVCLYARGYRRGAKSRLHIPLVPTPQGA